MLGGLYGDLPPPAGGEKGEDHKKPLLPPSWASNKLAPIIRKPAGYAPPPSVLRAQSGMAPPKVKPMPGGVQRQVASSAAPISSSRWAGDSPMPASSDSSPQELPYASQAMPPQVSQPTPVLEEYDPARPNDYDDLCRERRRKKMEEEMRREMERRRQEEEDREKELERQRELALQKASQRDIESSPGDTRSSALGISGEEAWRRRAALSAAASAKAMPDASPRVARSPSPPPSGGLGLGAKPGGGGGLTMGPGGQMSAAERMMAKMGWKAGEGLGKDRQGITTPLMARKTDKRAGVIVNASAKKVEVEAPTPPPEKKPKTGVAITGPPTRVLLLRNMVGRGEVDDDLEEEVAGECTKYGTVTRVLIFEITDPSWPPTESVRIFIEFERAESALKGLVDLDGRFFGGRVVRASFFDEEKFAANQLAPVPGEAPVDPNIMPM